VPLVRPPTRRRRCRAPVRGLPARISAPCPPTSTHHPASAPPSVHNALNPSLHYLWPHRAGSRPRSGPETVSGLPRRSRSLARRPASSERVDQRELRDAALGDDPRWAQVASARAKRSESHSTRECVMAFRRCSRGRRRERSQAYGPATSQRLLHEEWTDLLSHPRDAPNRPGAMSGRLEPRVLRCCARARGGGASRGTRRSRSG
jgi:hypothetical protein